MSGFASTALAVIHVRSPETVRSLSIIPYTALQSQSRQRLFRQAEVGEMWQIVWHRAKPAVLAERLFDLLILIFGNVEGEQREVLRGARRRDRI